jgi:hypothetical protein
MEAAFQFGDADPAQAVAADLCRQLDLQTAPAGIDHRAGQFRAVLLAGPEDPVAAPAGLAQLQRVLGIALRQGAVEDAGEVLVADDAHVAAQRIGAELLQALVLQAAAFAAEQTVDGAQVEGTAALDVLFDDTHQHGVGFGLVFLDWSGQGVARQFRQAVQRRTGAPPDARRRLRQRAEGQCELACALEDALAVAAAQAEALGHGAQACCEAVAVFERTAHGRRLAPWS